MQVRFTPTNGETLQVLDDVENKPLLQLAVHLNRVCHGSGKRLRSPETTRKCGLVKFQGNERKFPVLCCDGKVKLGLSLLFESLQHPFHIPTFLFFLFRRLLFDLR